MCWRCGDNLLTPQDRSDGIFAFAAEHDCGVLINKPLAQGLLTGSHHPAAPRVFGEGDHRARKRWFTRRPWTTSTGCCWPAAPESWT